MSIQNTPSTGYVKILGKPLVGQYLNLSTYSISDVDGFDYSSAMNYQWLRDGKIIPGANQIIYMLTTADLDSFISLKLDYTDLKNNSESITSNPTQLVAIPTNYLVNTPSTGYVKILGKPLVGQYLNISSYSISDVDGFDYSSAMNYQWLRDGKIIPGANQVIYKLTTADLNTFISLKLNYTDLKNHTESITSDPTQLVKIPPNSVPIGSVTITGKPEQNQTLTVSNTLADADVLGTISYQWFSDGVAITNSNRTMHALTQANVGKNISVYASYTDGLGNLENVTSSAVQIANVNDAPTGSVLISGTATQGQVLTVSNSLADLDGLGIISYQWLNAGTPINGANQTAYTLIQADVGKSISVTANYIDGFGMLENVSSNIVKIANINDAPTGSVLISGTATQGQVLTVSNSLADLDGLGIISYQWLNAGTPINGANQTAYTLIQADVGKSISVTANYTDSQGTKESLTSSSTLKIGNVNDIPTGNVSISGLAAQGQTLTIVNTLADLDGLGTIKYQWLSNGAAISGATKSSYVLVTADLGKTISVKANYTDLLGTSESVTSQLTDAVISTKPSKGNDVLTGTAKNETLSALAGNDILTGGLGADKLIGGLGADIFKYTSIDDSGVAVKTRDTITDFKHSQSDKIDLSAIALPNDQSFTYIGTLAFSADATAQLRLDPKTGILYGSTNADNTPEFSILLSGVKSLVPEDFVL